MNLIEILLVEDNVLDVEIKMNALEQTKLANRVFVAKDGVEALEYLHRQGRFSDAPRPSLVLLDLNMPRKDGREVLQEMKSDPELRKIPVVILTTSKAEEDIARSYDLHANCYITKPVDIEQFAKIVRAIDEFWFGIVQLPQD